MEFDLFLVDSPEARAGLDAVEVGIYYWYIGRFEKAEAVLRKSIAEVGYGYSVLARVLATAGRVDEMVALLHEAMERRPEEGLYAVVLAELLNELGHPRDALQVVSQWLAEPGSNQRYVGRLGEGDLATYSASRLTLAKAESERLLGRPKEALTTLRQMKDKPRTEAMKGAVEGIKLLEAIAYGKVYMDQQDWFRAEEKLKYALGREEKRHSSVYMLGQIYRAQGRFAEEEALRRDLLVHEGRMVEYFELAKLFRLTGYADQVPSLLASAVERIPSLKDSHEALYEIAAREGIRLIVMQYPSFSLDLLHQYAPEAPGVTFIDNERVFTANPDAYWYEPSFPNSFSHYTHDGALVLAEHVSNSVVQVVEDLGM
jgi:predicted Zn-dependent protease